MAIQAAAAAAIDVMMDGLSKAGSTNSVLRCSKLTGMIDADIKPISRVSDSSLLARSLLASSSCGGRDDECAV